MAVPNLMGIGYSGMSTAKLGISTSGHNIANANTEGFSRQRVDAQSLIFSPENSSLSYGNGAIASRISRVNDVFLEKQIQRSGTAMSASQEKDLNLRGLEDIFNEMNGDGLNRLIAGFFNDFRRLSAEPESQALRQAVKESSLSMVHNFNRLSQELKQLQHHLDNRLTGYVTELNTLSSELTELNQRIHEVLATKTGQPNDLLDKRDNCLKKMTDLVTLNVYLDNVSRVQVDIPGAGSLVSGSSFEMLGLARTDSEENGKMKNSTDILCLSGGLGCLTNVFQGGKIGGLIEVRDGIISRVSRRLDEIAFTLTQSVNELHENGVCLNQESGVSFFKPLDSQADAAGLMNLSDEILSDVSFIATALDQDSPADNRLSLQISELQYSKLVNNEESSLDDWYDSIIGEVGVATHQNQALLNQNKDILAQLNKFREQISGVSIDEETANLVQFQHIYDASAKVVQMADDLLKTVIGLIRS